MEKKRLGFDEVLPNIDEKLGAVQKPVTSYAEADRKKAGETVKNKGGRPIKGRSKATIKIAFHIDQELNDLLVSMIDFPKEKSASAVAKRILEAYCEPLISKA